MHTSRTADFRTIFVFGLFSAVVPLIFFPHNWGVELNWNFWGIAAVEFSLYFLLWWLVFSQEKPLTSLALAFQTVLLRWSCGVIFAILAVILAGETFWSGLQNGLYKYFPALFVQVVAAPLIIKLVLLDRRQKVRPPSHPSLVIGEEFAHGRRSAAPEALPLNLDELLGYIKDYSGVEACLLVDQEGLILAYHGEPHLEPEIFAPLAGLLESSCLKVLARIREKEIKRIETYTSHLRLTVQQVYPFRLLVLADRRTDDLLNIRIQRVVEQIGKSIREKYPQELLEPREEEHVSNSGRT